MRFAIARIKRTHPGIGPDDIIATDRLFEIATGEFAQIVDFVLIDFDRGRIAVEIHIGGADQGKVIFIRDGKDNPAIAILEDIAIIMVKDFRHNDVAALDQTNVGLGFGLHHAAIRFDQIRTPRTGGIDQHFTGDNPVVLIAVIIRPAQGYVPLPIGLGGTNAFGAGQDFGAFFAGIHGI